MAPVVHGLEADYAGRIDFSYLDIDDQDSNPFKSALGYKGQPHYFLLDADGNVVEQWRGSVPASDFVSAFESLLATES